MRMCTCHWLSLGGPRPHTTSPASASSVAPARSVCILWPGPRAPHLPRSPPARGRGRIPTWRSASVLLLRLKLHLIRTSVPEEVPASHTLTLCGIGRHRVSKLSMWILRNDASRTCHPHFGNYSCANQWDLNGRDDPTPVVVSVVMSPKVITHDPTRNRWLWGGIGENNRSNDQGRGFEAYAAVGKTETPKRL